LHTVAMEGIEWTRNLLFIFNNHNKCNWYARNSQNLKLVWKEYATWNKPTSICHWWSI
jgi:hypothetical protein